MSVESLMLILQTNLSQMKPTMCTLICYIVTSSCIVLLFGRKQFIDVYCHMLIAALEFTLRRSREIVLRTLYAHACHGIRAACGTWLSTSGDQRSLDPDRWTPVS